MYPLKSIWKNLLSDGHQPPERNEKAHIVDALLNELDYHIKDIERTQREKELDERRKTTGVDYSWLISTPEKGYEMSQLDRLELEELCYTVKADESGKILSLFRDTLYNEPKPNELPRLLKACIRQVTEQRPKEESLMEWVTKRTMSLTRLRPHTRVTPSNYSDPEIPKCDHESDNRPAPSYSQTSYDDEVESISV